MMLVGVPSTALETVWPKVAPMLERALRRADGDFTLADVYEWLAGREWQLWLWIEGAEVKCAATTTIITWPQRKVCSVPLVGGGSLKAWWSQGVDQIAEWAKGQGCDRLEGYDPRGAKTVWGYVLPGWFGAWTVIRRAL